MIKSLEFSLLSNWLFRLNWDWIINICFCSLCKSGEFPSTFHRFHNWSWFFLFLFFIIIPPFQSSQALLMWVINFALWLVCWCLDFIKFPLRVVIYHSRDRYHFWNWSSRLPQRICSICVQVRSLNRFHLWYLMLFLFLISVVSCIVFHHESPGVFPVSTLVIEYLAFSNYRMLNLFFLLFFSFNLWWSIGRYQCTFWVSRFLILEYSLFSRSHSFKMLPSMFLDLSLAIIFYCTCLICSSCMFNADHILTLKLVLLIYLFIINYGFKLVLLIYRHWLRVDPLFFWL